MREEVKMRRIRNKYKRENERELRKREIRDN